MSINKLAQNSPIRVYAQMRKVKENGLHILNARLMNNRAIGLESGKILNDDVEATLVELDEPVLECGPMRLGEATTNTTSLMIIGCTDMAKALSA